MRRGCRGGGNDAAKDRGLLVRPTMSAAEDYHGGRLVMEAAGASKVEREWKGSDCGEQATAEEECEERKCRKSHTGVAECWLLSAKPVEEKSLTVNSAKGSSYESGVGVDNTSKLDSGFEARCDAGSGTRKWRLRISDSRIKRRPCAGLPQAADYSRGGSSHASKRPPRATEAAQAVASHACNSNPRMLATASQRLVARRTRALAVAQAAAERWRPHKR
ncbi:hypothetical protein GW17_00055938 [Ensete ventricosum]|nr:hypothetical protein GW17_00055938 [Ensete ventricosum]